jgi:molybdate/tungstate transport system substrate-binding protein
MTKLAPGFKRATGYTLVDVSHGSKALATDIKNGIYVADVFVSASPAVNRTLEGARNGNWVSWYASFASSPEVLAYYPKSRFATALRTQPWYKVISESGFRLGRTDPSLDPGGVLAEDALTSTAKRHPRYAGTLRKLATESSDVYEEDTEQADVQSGQVDASFMYEADANSQRSPFVKLTGTNLSGRYTITQVKRAPDSAAAQAFIRYLLGPKGRAALKADKFNVVSPPAVTGSGVPAALKSLFAST